MIKNLFATHRAKLIYSSIRNYSSDQNNLKSNLIKATLLHVNKLGWTDQAIVAASQDLGYSSITSRVVTNGPIDVVYFAMDMWNKQMNEKLSSLELEKLKISERVKEGIKIRLQCEIPYFAKWHQAMGLGAYPTNLPTTINKLMKISDDIWYIAGDRSIDFNWYTKRGLLLAAYLRTELFMLTDQSEKYNETWKFLDRQIDDVLSLGRKINETRNYGYAFTVGAQSLVSILKKYPERTENDIENLRNQMKSQPSSGATSDQEAQK